MNPSIHRRPSPFRDQHRLADALIGATAVVFYGVLLVAAARTGVGPEAAVADPQETTNLRLLGIVSNVGVLFWTTTLAASLLTALVLTDRAAEAARFFWASAAVTAMLLIDDFLLVHEFADDVATAVVDFQPTRRRKDFLEMGVFAVYAAVVAWYLHQHRVTILATRHRRLRLAGAFLLSSLLIDAGLIDVIPSGWVDVSSQRETVVEEGAKLVGICYVTAYIFGSARSALTNDDELVR